MPGAVPVTSTYALTNATLPYVLALAEHGVDGALAARPGPAHGAQRARRRDHPSGRRRSARAPRHDGRTDAETARNRCTATRETDGQHRDLQNFIDGEPSARRGRDEPVLNPATGEEIAQAPLSSAEDVDAP